MTFYAWLLQVAGRLAFPRTQRPPAPPGSWPWAGELAAAFAGLNALPAAAG